MWHDMRAFYVQRLREQLDQRPNNTIEKRNLSTPRKELDHFATDRWMATIKMILSITASLAFLVLITLAIASG